ncbi:hypothetical protein N7493_007244 [Penicillium malachiteum]|uniref:Uncharacterized protein n=1 Tax=Penicillium malachiteum TaxID=1324776 RepID=A0AAD6MUR8_9EURO|nr:hypothetical protein N7493_007244 [Penicillium malachiteum]
MVGRLFKDRHALESDCYQTQIKDIPAYRVTADDPRFMSYRNTPTPRNTPTAMLWCVFADPTKYPLAIALSRLSSSPFRTAPSAFRVKRLPTPVRPKTQAFNPRESPVMT